MSGRIGWKKFKQNSQQQSTHNQKQFKATKISPNIDFRISRENRFLETRVSRAWAEPGPWASPQNRRRLFIILLQFLWKNPSISQNKMSDNNKTYASVAAGKGGNKGKSPKSGKEWDKAVKELEKEKRAYLTPKQQS